MASLSLIKLGGSLITNKSKLFTLREDVLKDIVSQIAKAWFGGELFILGHGSGSFGHAPAEKYQTIRGRVDEQSAYGAAMVADAASQLNRLVITECLKQKLPAVSVSPLSIAQARSRQAKRLNMSPVIAALKSGLVPVVYGDLIFDEDQDYTIWSTETVLNTIAMNWQNENGSISKVIHCGETDGFLLNGQVVQEINQENLDQMKAAITETAGFDVTGGMLHKVEESLKLATEKGIDSYIIGGNHGGNLYRAMVGKDFIGTKVTV